MKIHVLIVTALTMVVAGCASLVSTSTNPAERQAQLNDSRCSGTYKHMLNFAEYFPPRRVYGYIMYNPKKVGFRGYDLLGDVYYRGCAKADLAPDKIAAAYWYQAAAVAHVPEAQWKLGRMLLEGDGVPVNHDAGLAWLTSAAIEGSTNAATFLRAHSYPVPAPIYPNSYAVAAERAQQQLDAARAAEHQQAVRDLASLLVNVGTIYVAAKVGAAAIRSEPIVHSPNVNSMPQLRMTKPVFCTTSGSANAVGDTVFINLRRFCN
jgi:hypothetical protein